MRFELLKARKTLGITQKELAQRVGIDRATMSRIENGKFTPDVLTAIRICRELGLTVESAFGHEATGGNV